VAVASALQLQAPDVARVVLGWFGPVLYHVCAESAISQLLIKILISVRFSNLHFLEESNNLVFGEKTAFLMP